MENHSLTFATERGSLKIEIEQDLELFKQLNSNSSDYYFLSKLKEIKNEILLLNQQKIDNDIIWKLIRFKTYIGIMLHLYQRDDNSYFVSLVEPSEWKNPEYFKYIGTYTLSTKHIWDKVVNPE